MVRPFARRAERMARPARVRIRRRKPWFFARRRLLGWKVRLLIITPCVSTKNLSKLSDMNTGLKASKKRLEGVARRNATHTKVKVYLFSVVLPIQFTDTLMVPSHAAVEITYNREL